MNEKWSKFYRALVLAGALIPPACSFGQETNSGTRLTPLTRPELKRFLEDVKVRVPRIPLPALTDQEREKLGDQVDNYESRVRLHFLNGIEPARPIPSGQSSPSFPGPSAGTSAGTAPTGAREQDPSFTLDNAFKIELFWIVSRVNNCQYCIGHQESKLLGAGRTEDQIAALDGDWSEFDPAQRLAFEFARKFTYQPYLLNDSDIIGLKKHYTESQILEMLLSMSGNNSINRWKEGIGVPQRSDEGGYSRLAALGRSAPIATAPIANGQAPHPLDAKELGPNLPRGSYLTPTSPHFANKVSKVAAFSVDTNPSLQACPTMNKLPPLESRDFVMKMLQDCRDRKPRLGLVDDAQARRDIPGCASIEGALPAWVRLIAHFPKAGSSRFATYRAAEENGDLSPLLKAQLSWIVARQDRAWYALGLAHSQLLQLGQSEDQIFELDGDWARFPARDQTLFQVAKKLATSPVVLSDDDVKRAVETAGPRDVVQTISFTTSRASFNRLTEAAGLPL